MLTYWQQREILSYYNITQLTPNCIMNTNELQSYFAHQAELDRNETQGLSTLINSQRTQSDYAKCYKPYRTLKNY